MQHSITGNHRLRARPPARGSVFTYAAVAIFGTAFFFFLHHLGNQIPYDLAKQKFPEEFNSKPHKGRALKFGNAAGYCEISSSVMASARNAGDNGSLVDDAVIQKTVDLSGTDCRPAITWKLRCCELERVVNDEEFSITRIKTRYWWGSKALYAIALRHLSIHEYRQLIRVTSYLAWGLLAFSLLLLSPKTLAVVAPVILFGIFFSGIEFWSDLPNGTPYAWAVLSSAILAFLMSRRTSRLGSPGAARIFCFIIGMVSSYLWLGDGHTFLSITLVGLVAWFGGGGGGGGDHSKASERAELAVSCIVLYLAGFAICYALGQLVKLIVLGSDVWWSFWNQAIVVFDRTVSGERVLSTGELLRRFRIMAEWSIHHPVNGSLIWFSAFALAGSLSFAAILARRARFGLLWDVLWIVCLLLINWLNFLVSEDVSWRTPRFMFVPHALGLSCLILAIMKMNRRHSLIGVLLAGGVYFWFFRFPPISDAAHRKVSTLIETNQPAVRSHFDVYLDGNRLVYVRGQCTIHDVMPKFFLHVVPVDEKDLPDHRRRHGFDNLDFHFINHELPMLQDGTCVAVRPLPDYDVASIRVGQFLRDHERNSYNHLWEGRIHLGDMTDG